MAVNQNNLDELRYIRRQNLTQESKIVGNWYRDVLRSYGVDCNYYKLKIPYPEVFKTIVDQNNIVRAAYGEDPDPNYKISAEMITYMEVENDIFQLNKFGAFPSTNVNFYFDSKDFATALAYKLGQFKEYPIEEQVITIEFTADEAEDFKNLTVPFSCKILSGECTIPFEEDFEFDLDKKASLPVEVVKASEPHLDFPVNEYIYKSFNYTLKAPDADDIVLSFDFMVKEAYPGIYKLSGKLHGVVLFRDLSLISKYSEEIHPEVGDIVTIDFPDAKSREQYQITEAVDINLASDGINPLLHRYIWKCKAIRYVPNAAAEIPEKNEANERVLEKMDAENAASEIIAKKISEYPNQEDDIYGGYERNESYADLNNIPESKKKILLDSISDSGSLIDIMAFSSGAALKTNGFDLYFKSPGNNWFKLTQYRKNGVFLDTTEEIDFLKATDDMLVFVNIMGEQTILCRSSAEKDELLELSATTLESEFCLVSLKNLTTFGNGYQDLNEKGDTFYKFANCGTLLMSIGENLYAKMGSGKIFKLN